MALEANNYDWHGITARRAQVLGALAEGYRLSEVADRLNLSYNGVRSHVFYLKTFTGCGDVSELGRFWRDHRMEWVRHQLQAAGVRPGKRGVGL